MAQVFTVQDDVGSVANANAYGTEAEFIQYHEDRGNTYTATTAQIEAAIVKGSDFLDLAFSFKGYKRTSTQTTEFPRRDLYDKAGNLINGIPDVVKEAVFEYAYYLLSGTVTTLAAVPSRSSTGTSVKAERTKAGPIESEIEYESGGVYSTPVYPLADMKLKKAGLVQSGGNLIRG